MDTTILEQLIYASPEKKILQWIKSNTDPKLLLFYRAEGDVYLQNKQDDSSDKEWYQFISNLYEKILNNTYEDSGILFKCPLSKVQIYKVSKLLSEKEKVFVTELHGENLDIPI